MQITEVFYPTNRAEWRAWLETHHQTKPEVWVQTYLKASGRPSISYDDLVEECLCFGWIDGAVKKYDADSKVQRITPRRKKSFLSELNRQRVKNLYHVGRMLYEQMNVSGAFLVSATRLGGLHGYGADGASAPLGGAVVGFTKAYKRERGTALVKAVDFEVSRKTAAYADALIAETLYDPASSRLAIAANSATASRWWNGLSITASRR